MDTSRMLKLTEMNSGQLFNLFSQTEKLLLIAEDSRAVVEMSLCRKQIEDVFRFYNLGTVVAVYQIFGGYVNKSFGVYTEKNGKKYEYYVRKYKRGITEKEIELEHTLIDFSIANGLEMAAGLIRNNDGKTYVKLAESSNGNIGFRCFAVYDFLSGEDKYTWDTPYLDDDEYASSAEVLAIFHNASRQYDPKGRERIEPKIMELIPTLPKTYKGFAELDLNNKFHNYYLKSIDEILRVIDGINIPPAAVSRMIYNPVHADIHPGNLKYKDGQAVGIFDFDWAKIDLRLFDVCEALAYFCSAWDDLPDGSTDGTLRLDKCAIFLKSYQKTLKELGSLSPLNDVEKEFFPTMMAAANMYLINWAVTAYYADPENLNVYEYKTYLQHNVGLMKWIEKHKKNLAELVQSL